jgi:hypothetical protein
MAARSRRRVTGNGVGFESAVGAFGSTFRSTGNNLVRGNTVDVSGTVTTSPSSKRRNS